MGNLDFIITMLINLIITILGYCTIPIILRILNGKYEYEKGHKIVLINCAIVWLIFTIIKIEQGMNANSAAVFLYYIIDRAILLKPKKETTQGRDNKENYSLSFENEKIEEKNANLTYSEDVRLEGVEEEKLNNLIEKLEKENSVTDQPKEINETTITVDSSEEIDDKKSITVFYIVIVILIAIIIGVGIYAFNLKNIYESKIEELESENAVLELKEILWDAYEEKIDFFEENIVFVIDGYGNYYYTYDQMEQVTQGIEEYSYWAYNKEQAEYLGYNAWK